MKKQLLSLLACFCASITIAQTPSLSGGLYQHVIDVEAFSDWGKGYLTITDNHCVTIEGTRYTTAFDPILDPETTPKDPETGELIVLDEAIPDIGNHIYEVNGKSTLNMTPEEFYAITDTASEFTLRYENNERNIVTYSFWRYTYKATIVNNYGWPSWSPQNDDCEAGLPTFMLAHNKVYSRLYNRKQACGSAMSEVSDENFDFHNIQTYDYEIAGDDPLNDKKILDEIHKGDWIRDTEHPDIIFTIKKNKDGNYLHMELMALDAKRINKKKKNAPQPIVWQMTVDRERQKNENMMDAYIDYAGWAGMPITDRFCIQQYALYRTSGIHEIKDRIVQSYYDDRLCSFLELGDEIIKIEVYENRQIHERNTTKPWFDWNKKHEFKKDDITLHNLDYHLCVSPHVSYMVISNKWEYRNINDYIVITYKRGRKKMTGTVRPQFVNASRAYFYNKEQLSNLK